MGALPYASHPIFVDAALSGGVGGFFGDEYFSWATAQLKPYLIRCEGWHNFPIVDIAWLELLAACIAVYLFAPQLAGRIVHLYSDNTNTVA